MSTPLQLRAAVQTIAAIAEAIRELGEVPSGELYVRIMDNISHSNYEKAIGILVNAGLVEKTPSHLLRWTGPKTA